MRRRPTGLSAYCVALLIALLGARIAVAANSALPERFKGVHSQLRSVAAPVSSYYPKAGSIGLAIVVVPDPHVPRYRRLYDLRIAALELGMLKDGFVLDRYAFPWSEELRRVAEPSAAGAGAGTGSKVHAPGDPAEGSGIDSNAYGLMVFRCDAWRGDPCVYPSQTAAPSAQSVPPQPTAPQLSEPQDPRSQLAHATRIRALYLVTETATSGVARNQLKCAIEKIQSQVKAQAADPSCPADPDSTDYSANSTLLDYPASACAAGSSRGSNLVVLGPSFSGGMDSIGATVNALSAWDDNDICLISSSATDSTNAMLRDTYPRVRYDTLALTDNEKLAHIAQLADQLGAKFYSDPNSVALLAEASTFGYGVCARHRHNEGGSAGPRPSTASGWVGKFCARAKLLYFQPTIADIRFGLEKQAAQQANELTGIARQFQDTHHLSLEVAAENGSEFPESQQSAITAAGNQLQLDRVFEALTVMAPKIVVIAATDVRDRLFLFDQLREKLPRAMLIDLEADNLLAHPEFLHASRGALAVASVNLSAPESDVFGCEPTTPKEGSLASWSIDSQGILADSVARLYEFDPTRGASQPPCVDHSRGKHLRMAALQVVTFNGFKPISYAFPELQAEAPSLEAGGPARLDLSLLVPTEYCALMFCIAVPSLWLWPWSRRSKRAGQAAGAAVQAPPEGVILGTAIALCAPVLLLAPWAAHHSSLQVTHPLMYWVLAIELIGGLAIWRCYGQIRQSLWAAGERIYSGCWLPLGLALMATAFAATPLLMRQPRAAARSSASPLIDDDLLTALGLDPDAGLGFYLIVALATLMTLYASAVVATRTWVVRRNLRLLALASAQVDGSVPFAHEYQNRRSADRCASAPHGYRQLPMWLFFLCDLILVAILAMPGLLDQFGGPRLTVFGPVAARVAVLALAATTLCAAILLCGVFGAGLRIRALSGYIRCRVLEARGHGDPDQSVEIPGLWLGGAEVPVTFPATPVLARVNTAIGYGHHTPALEAAGNISCEATAEQWAESLSGILFSGKRESRHRFALFALLAAEMSLFRWIALGAILCALASVMIVYLYPIEADTLLIMNLAILALTGVLCAYMAVVFEGDEVLSNVLCNRAKKTQASVGLFGFIAFPFVALAAAVAIIGVPGVVDWAGGLLAMLRAFGLHP